MESWSPPTRVGNYVVAEKIGIGAFGSCYHGRHNNKELHVAIKFELESMPNPQLRYESQVYHQLEGVKGVLQPLHFEKVVGTGAALAMVLPLIGLNMEMIFRNQKGVLSQRRIHSVALQALERLKDIHNRGIIHRDIKPENFVYGIGENEDLLYLIDFGLSKIYIDPQTNTHIPKEKKHCFIGTPRYVSIHVHQGKQQSRRDDVFSLGLMLLYFTLGKLPWQSMETGPVDTEYYNRVWQQKEQFLKNLSSLPAPFPEYFREIIHLKFKDRPPYEKLKALFTQSQPTHLVVWSSIPPKEARKREEELQ